MTPSTPIAANASSPLPSAPPSASSSPRTNVPGAQSSFSRSGSLSIRGALKVPSSPRSDPQSRSPKIPSSSSRNSPRVFFISSPEESHRIKISDTERVQLLIKVFSVFMNTREVLKKIAQQMLEEMGTDQDEIYQTFEDIVHQDEVDIGESYKAAVRAKEEFLKNFNPWYQALVKAVIPAFNSHGNNHINHIKIDTEVAKILNRELKKLLKNSTEQNVKEEDEIDPIFLSEEYREFTQNLENFRQSLGPLCQKYKIDFSGRLQAFRFLMRDKSFDAFSQWIRHHFLHVFCGAKQFNSDESTPAQIEQFSTEIVDQKDWQLFTNLLNLWGKKSALINYYNRALIQFFIRNTNLLFISPEVKAVRIRILLLWELCQLSRFVSRLERYLGETSLQHQSLNERVIALLNSRGSKASKIVIQAFDFLKGCQEVGGFLKMLSELSTSPVYPRLQEEVQFKLINYLSEQGFSRKNSSQEHLPDIRGP